MGDTNTGAIPTFGANQAPTSKAGYHNDFDYENHMGKYYKTGTKKIENDGNKRGNTFKKDKDPNTDVLDYKTGILDTTFGDGKMYNKFRHRYRRLLFNWNPVDATLHSSETYTPIMTIMSGKVADLVLHLDIKEEPDEIVFEFNDNDEAKKFLSLDKEKITSSISTTITVATPSVTDKINHILKIICKGEFDQEYTLFARAITKSEPKGEVCGMLRILPNGQMYQHNIKVVLFKVITNINGGPTNNEGECPSNALNKFINVLGQALVIPEIITIKDDGTRMEIDTLAPKHPSNNLINFVDDFCDKTDPKNIVIDDADSNKVQLFLWQHRPCHHKEASCPDTDCAEADAGYQNLLQAVS